MEKQKTITDILQIRPKDSMFAVLRTMEFADLMNLCRNIKFDPNLQLVVEYWAIATNLARREKPWPWYRVLAYSTVPTAMVPNAVVGFSKGEDCFVRMTRASVTYETKAPRDFSDDIYDARIVIMRLMNTRHPFPKILSRCIIWEGANYEFGPHGDNINIIVHPRVPFTAKQLFDIHSGLFANGFQFYNEQHQGGREVLFGKKYKE